MKSSRADWDYLIDTLILTDDLDHLFGDNNTGNTHIVMRYYFLE